jgi:dTDP-4-amino-4,6-dideoxygalactose transaminase
MEAIQVPMVDLNAQHGRLARELEAAVSRVVESARFIGGEEVESFEAEFAAACGVRHACGVGNGTDALVLALRALGVGPGDEVVAPAFTFFATVEAILLVGATPVLVDVDPASATLDPALLARAIGPRTRAVVPVHLYGQPAAMDEILELASRHDLWVIEDAAQAHGAELGGRRAGSLGHVAAFSFYPGKNLGAWGDAGAVVSNDAALVARVRSVARHGAGAHRYEHLVPGTNSRLDALQAAVLRVKLRQLAGWNEERRARVRAYDAGLAGLPGLGLPRERAGARSAWHLYTVRVADREGLRARLGASGVATAVHYPKPVHLQPALAGLAHGELPVSEQLAREVLSLPLYPELPLDVVARICREIRAFSEMRSAPLRA